VNTADSLVITSPDTLQLKARHHYNAAVLIVQGGRLFVTPVSPSPGDSSGFVWLEAPLIQVLDSAKIIADGRGYRGGNPEGGNGLGPGGGGGGLAFAGGGGGGYGGSGGRGGPANGGGAGGPAYDISLIDPGSGGGAGNQGGGAGGRGGGAILLDGSFTCNITGTLSALGENADPNQIEGGGGGSGGRITIQAPGLVTLRGVLSGSGGNGGDGGDNGGGGGGGGRFRIVFYSIDSTGISYSVAGGQGGYATIGEPGLPGNPGTVFWGHVPGVEEREISDILGIRSSVAVVPNPSRGQCEFRFNSIPRGAPLALELYDPLGRLVRTLDAGPGGPKPSAVLYWDGRDEAGREVSSGVYFYRTRDGRTQGKVLVLR
jgi:hypothetical protein